MKATEPPATGPWRILLAEDETVTRMAAVALLRRAGHSVVAVEDGPSAVAAAIDAAQADAAFDLILMDLGLPGFDGDEAVRRIRAHPTAWRGHGRIVMLSATATPAGEERCRRCGADGVLAKPLRLDALEVGLRGATAPPTATDGAFDAEAIAQMRELLPGAVAADLIARTAATLHQYRAALNDAWTAGDRDAVAAMAHKVAGVSGQYGCLALRRAARTMEAAAESGNGTSMAFTALDAAYGPALEYLNAKAAER